MKSLVVLAPYVLEFAGPTLPRGLFMTTKVVDAQPELPKNVL